MRVEMEQAFQRSVHHVGPLSDLLAGFDSLPGQPMRRAREAGPSNLPAGLHSRV